MTNQYGNTKFVDDFNYRNFQFKNKYNEEFGFAAVTAEFVQVLSKFIKLYSSKPVLEIMSGKGYLAYMLNKAGVKIIATDIQTENNKYYKIEQIEATQAIKKYAGDIDFIIMSWPEYRSASGKEALKAMREYAANAYMIFIGENKDGCTADDEFYDILEYAEGEIKKSFEEIESSYVPFAIVHDIPMLIK
ncbi:MAG: hypothetical protein LBQ16_00585 [Gracilibacteraceae bacterium]|jgi:hypothetical protein|nr:hypothetical protein [Gracilibacteraceae bacterium]